MSEGAGPELIALEGAGVSCLYLPQTAGGRSMGQGDRWLEAGEWQGN